MDRSSFLFIIGFRNNTAIVDGKQRKTYGRLSTIELAEAGLYCPAVRSGVYDATDQPALLQWFQENTPFHATEMSELTRLFGVGDIPSSDIKVKII